MDLQPLVNDQMVLISGAVSQKYLLLLFAAGLQDFLVSLHLHPTSFTLVSSSYLCPPLKLSSWFVTHKKLKTMIGTPLLALSTSLRSCKQATLSGSNAAWSSIDELPSTRIYVLPAAQFQIIRRELLGIFSHIHH